jgi:hypothetical protein
MTPPIRVLHQAVRPFVAASLRGGIPTPLTAAVPTDAPVGVVPGPDPDRILALGGIGGSGVGLRTHAEGVAAQSARALAAITGRGVEWRTVPLADQHLTATQEAVRQITELHRYDVVLVMPGVADALELTRITPWVHHLEDLLDHACTYCETCGTCRRAGSCGACSGTTRRTSPRARPRCARASRRSRR